MSDQEQQREYDQYQQWQQEREAREEQEYHIYLEDRIKELETKAQWQPIETAPKDEQVLVVYLEPFFGHLTQEIDTAYLDSESGIWAFYMSEKPIRGGGVTHWMPLPEPPEE